MTIVDGAHPREVSDFLADLPNIVRARRGARQLSLRDAATEIGMGHTTLARLERGNACSVRNVLAILAWLDRDG